MKPHRIEQLLANQSSTARKVFDNVPAQEPWSAQRIHGEVSKVSSVDYRTVCGCLADLKSQGIIREVSRMRYQRHAVTVKLGDLMPELPETPLAEPAQKEPEPVTNLKTPAMAEGTVNLTAAGMAKLCTLPADPLSRLAELAQKVRKTAAAHQVAMNELADGIDEVALSVEAERETTTKSMEKFHQLQGLLKSIGMGE